MKSTIAVVCFIIFAFASFIFVIYAKNDFDQKCNDKDGIVVGDRVCIDSKIVIPIK